MKFVKFLRAPILKNKKLEPKIISYKKLNIEVFREEKLLRELPPINSLQEFIEKNYRT